MKKHEFENIDSLFKQELDLSDVKAPDSIKLEIDQQLNAKAKRRRFFFIIIPLLAVFLISIPFIVNYTSTDNPTPEQAENLNNVATHESVNENGETNKVTTKVENISDSNISADNSTTANINTSINTEDQNKTSDANTIMSSSSEPTTITKVDIQHENEEQKQNENENEKKEQNADNGPKEIVNEVEKTDDEEKGNTSDNEITSEDSDTEKLNGETVTEKAHSEKTEETDQTTNNQSNNTKDNVDTTSIEEIAKTDVDSTYEEIVNEVDSTNNEEIAEADSTDTNEEPDVEITPKDEDKYKPWFISVYGGPKFKRSNLTASDTSVVYTNALSDKVGFGIGADVNYRLKNGLMFGTGAEYASYNESYDYQKEQIALIDSNVTWNVFVFDSIPDSSGWIYLYDSTQNVTYNYDTVSVYNQQGTNQTSYLHLPFRFGGQFIVNKWRFDAYIQGRFNLLLRTNATYVLNDQIVNSTLTGSYFDLELGGAAHFNVWKNLYLTGVIRYRPPLRNPYYDPNFQNKMQYLYLGFGASINL